MKDNKDILLDDNYDLTVKDGDFAVGDSTVQELECLFKTNQGELKKDPIIGMGLFRFIKSRVTDSKLRRLLKIQLKRDGKNYDELKDIFDVIAKKQ